MEPFIIKENLGGCSLIYEDYKKLFDKLSYENNEPLLYIERNFRCLYMYDNINKKEELK
jgi:hypothetical protein